MNVILAHDSFTQLGGAERVVLALAEAFPEAPIYTLVADKRVLAQLPVEVQKRIRTTPLQWLYRLYPKFQHLLPFIPCTLWFTRLQQCDILLSSSSAFAKGFRKPKGAKHINYCHTPARFLWVNPEYVSQEVPAPLRLGARIFLAWMKSWDLRSAKDVDVFIANSREVQKRIKQYYHRDSAVVYPFVDSFWHATRAKEKYFLIAGRLHAHKQNDLVVKACKELGLELHVVGSGRDEAKLRALAGPGATFLGRVSDEQLRDEFSGARGYIYPQVEDFGLMPVEAAACGTASIGVSEGGSLETIIPRRTGELFGRGNPNELKELLERWDENKYSVEALREHAGKFSKDRFLTAIKEVVTTAAIKNI